MKVNGKKIKKMRKEVGLYQYELAELIGYKLDKTDTGWKSTSMCHLEKEKRGTGLETLWKIAYVLGVDMEELIIIEEGDKPELPDKMFGIEEGDKLE